MKEDDKISCVSGLIWLGVFSAAFAYIESAIVVYLRLLYYPDGFTFPIVLVPNFTAMVELGREACTIVILYTVSRLIFKKPMNIFCGFMYCFGIWDIFYYIWLYVFLGWPESLFTWDILFLIPLPWIGPVLAPVIVSLSMITAAVIILRLDLKGIRLYNNTGLWITVISAGLIIILSFIIDCNIVLDQTVPVNFKWWIFLLGEFTGIAAFGFALWKTYNRQD